MSDSPHPRDQVAELDRPDPGPFHFPVTVRYAEVDQQGVVFNAWYLVWTDEAFTAWLTHRDIDYPDITAMGVDLVVANTEVTYRLPVAYRDAVVIEVAVHHVGNSSLTLEFVVRVDGEARVKVRTIYVCVAHSGGVGVGSTGGKVTLPDPVRHAVGQARPMVLPEFPRRR